MEYRGYDSAGLEVEGDEPGQPLIYKEVGKVSVLKELVDKAPVDMGKTFLSQTSIAHTRSVFFLSISSFHSFADHLLGLLVDGLLTVFPRLPTVTLT